MADDQAYAGLAALSTTASDYNALDFMMRMLMSENATAKLVKVVKVTNAGELAPAGVVDVLPLVGMLSGDGQVVPHVTVYSLPYMRVQGGANAVIIDPAVGDIGVAVFCDRDISTVKETKEQGPPGSYRQFSISDGLYLGGFLNAVPNQYVRFSEADGIILNSPTHLRAQIADNGPSFDMTSDQIRIALGNVAINLTENQALISNNLGFIVNLTAAGVSMNAGPGGNAYFYVTAAGDCFIQSTTGNVYINGALYHSHVHTNGNGGGNTGPITP